VSDACPLLTRERRTASSLVVDIADLKVSDDPNAVIVTYALGSCIAVILHDPAHGIGGMLHYMLPSSRASPEKAARKPGMFANTGIPLLFQSMYALGSSKSDLVVKIAGGGAMYDDNGTFNIGKRNYTVLRKILWKAGVLIDTEDVGGTKSRTVRLHIGDGRVTVHSRKEETQL